MTRAGRWLAAAGAGVVLLALVAVPVQTAGASGAPAVVSTGGFHPGTWPTFQPGRHHASAPAGAQLTYYGGPVVSDMRSVDVSYGPDSYVAAGHPGAGTMAAFTGQFLGSGVNDWLAEYGTSKAGGTHQTIGRGTYGGTITITPAPADDGSVVTDAQVQAELNAQITAGVLPVPDANTSYTVFFPLGQRICQGGSCSLVAGGFCAYHGTFLRNGSAVTYQVMPDLTGTTGCGNSNDLGNTTSVLSHELTETITDPNVGLATVVGPPLGWYDTTNGEIGDICNAQQGTFVGTDAVTYTVQAEFSDVRNDCIVGTVPVPLAVVTTTLAPGSAGVTYLQTLTASGGNAPYTWKLVKASGALPKGVKLSKAGILSGTPKAAGTYSFTVEALDTKSSTKPKTQNTATQALTLTVT